MPWRPDHPKLISADRNIIPIVNEAKRTTTCVKSGETQHASCTPICFSRRNSFAHQTADRPGKRIIGRRERRLKIHPANMKPRFDGNDAIDKPYMIDMKVCKKKRRTIWLDIELTQS